MERERLRCGPHPVYSNSMCIFAYAYYILLYVYTYIVFHMLSILWFTCHMPLMWSFWPWIQGRVRDALHLH